MSRISHIKLIYFLLFYIFFSSFCLSCSELTVCHSARRESLIHPCCMTYCPLPALIIQWCLAMPFMLQIHTRKRVRPLIALFLTRGSCSINDCKKTKNLAYNLTIQWSLAVSWFTFCGLAVLQIFFLDKVLYSMG